MPKPTQPLRQLNTNPLDAIFGSDTEVLQNLSVRLEAIHLPQQQPRRYFDLEKMKGLVESIKQHGILEPLLVRPLDTGGYELVAGERRYKAAKEVGLSEVPVTIRHLSNEEALQLTLIENLQREDLNPVEETEGVLQLLSLRLKLPQDEVVSLLHRMLNEVRGKLNTDYNNVIVEAPEGKTIKLVFESLALMNWESFVTNRLPLLKLPKDVLEALRQGTIAYTKAQAIARVKDEAQRQLLLREAIKANLSLSQIREKIRGVITKFETESPKTRIGSVYRQVAKSKVWENPKKWKQVEALLTKIEAIVSEN
jgi:ParB family chromosome partitioning protein